MCFLIRAFHFTLHENSIEKKKKKKKLIYKLTRGNFRSHDIKVGDNLFVEDQTADKNMLGGHSGKSGKGWAGANSADGPGDVPMGKCRV